ncbi:hypothetical protein [Parendozoicomonas sp. Alg238-R29]|uniref:hypothetical protein n=1 Tax=Parendozoicomonas sp. Alg238-R29 TaxID=2993446 RepID=UPI00248E78BF|nr:hypothetical protein [Parendozoicomonas sp. Alg238-R29]
MAEYLFSVLLLAVPAVVIYLCHRFPLLDNLGSAALCFLASVAFGQLMEHALHTTAFRPVAEDVLGIFIAFALPLLLFSSDVKAWFTLASRTMISMIIAMMTVVFLATLLTLFFQSHINELPYIASMAVGNFTGSLVNGAALKTGLQASNESFLLVYGYDVLISSLYLLFLITFAHKFARKVLPPFQSADTRPVDNERSEFDEYRLLLAKKSWQQLRLPLGSNLLIIGIALSASSLVSQNAQTATAIVTLTVLSLAASFNSRIRTTKSTYPLGMYLILLFCLFSGTLFSKSILEQATFSLLAFFLALAFGAVIVHMLFCHLFRIDADTFLVTSVAAILSPPFVPLAANVMHNRTILLSGMSAGVLGYACGNILGLFTYWLIQQLT